MTVEHDMTEQQRLDFIKRRRRRSIALGVTLALLVAIFYAITVVKLGPDVLVRDL